MSAIVGFVHLDGLSAEPGMVSSMLDALPHRGSDAVRQRVSGAVGFGLSAPWPLSIRSRTSCYPPWFSFTIPHSIALVRPPAIIWSAETATADPNNYAMVGVVKSTSTAAT